MTPTMKHLLLAPQGIVKAGLVAWYDLRQGADAQVLYDLSGNGNNGQLGSAAGSDTNDPSWAPEGLSFGGDDWVQLPALNFTKFSVTAVVSRISVGAVVIAKRDNTNYSWEMGIDGSANALVCRVNANTNVAQSANGTTPVSLYQMLTMSYDNNFIRGYVNNNEMASAGYASAVTSSSVPITIGKRSYTGAESYLGGTVAYVMIYDRSLLPKEINQNYKAVKKILTGRGVFI